MSICLYLVSQCFCKYWGRNSQTSRYKSHCLWEEGATFVDILASGNHSMISWPLKVCLHLSATAVFARSTSTMRPIGSSLHCRSPNWTALLLLIQNLPLGYWWHSYCWNLPCLYGIVGNKGHKKTSTSCPECKQSAIFASSLTENQLEQFHSVENCTASQGTCQFITDDES